MSKKIDAHLGELAHEVVHKNDDGKFIILNDGEDYQGHLYILWKNCKFYAAMEIYSDPVTTGSYSPVAINPPETSWREEFDDFESVKIQAVADWVKSWGFSLKGV